MYPDETKLLKEFHEFADIKCECRNEEICARCALGSNLLEHYIRK